VAPWRRTGQGDAADPFGEPKYVDILKRVWGKPPTRDGHTPCFRLLHVAVVDTAVRASQRAPCGSHRPVMTPCLVPVQIRDWINGADRRLNGATESTSAAVELALVALTDELAELGWRNIGDPSPTYALDFLDYPPPPAA
jgi:hypothetical protein